MLTLAFNEQQDIIHIDDAEKGKTYKCPDCGESVFPKKGEVYNHHYCHKTSDCGGNGESVVHKYYKQYIANLKEVEYNGVIMQVTQSYIEKQLVQGLVADVILVLNGWKSIAVEICYKHEKDLEHINKYKELNLECYEVYVDMNEEQTDFEIIDWKCLWGYECYEMEVWQLERKNEILEKDNKLRNEEICKLQNQIALNKEKYKRTIKNFQDMIDKLKQELKGQKWQEKQSVAKDTEEMIKEVTGYTYRELQSVYYNNKTNDKYYLLDMIWILDSLINDDVKMIQFNWVKAKRSLSGEKIFTITFLDWKKNHVVKSINNIKCSSYSFNVLARIITDRYGIKVYKNENGVY